MNILGVCKTVTVGTWDSASQQYFELFYASWEYTKSSLGNAFRPWEISKNTKVHLTCTEKQRDTRIC